MAHWYCHGEGFHGLVSKCPWDFELCLCWPHGVHIDSPSLQDFFEFQGEEGGEPVTKKETK